MSDATMTLSNTQSLTLFSQFFALSFYLCCLPSLIVFTCNLANKNCEVLITGIIQINRYVKPTFTSFWVSTIEIELEQAPIVVFVYFFPHLNMQKTADYGPQQH